MAASADPQLVTSLENDVGHPGEKWDALVDHVQSTAATDFADIQVQWLDLMWTLDMYRSRALVPRGMGNPKVAAGHRLAAVYRSKGNWYAELIALLLGNRTSQKLAPRTKVEGFSQLHQIDVAWPDRSKKPIEDPRICLETKLTGAPPYDDTAARGATADWSNRRKELKFAATDLKLARRGTKTKIDHWDEWRIDQEPLCYFLWGARMTANDKIDKMVKEVQALTKTYLDGAGVFAWREKPGGGYEAVNVAIGNPSDRVSTIDDMLQRIGARIGKMAPTGAPPPPIAPSSRPVDPKSLAPDNTKD